MSEQLADATHDAILLLDAKRRETSTDPGPGFGIVVAALRRLERQYRDYLTGK